MPDFDRFRIGLKVSVMTILSPTACVVCRVIRFVQAKENGAAQIYRQLCTVYCLFSDEW